MVFSGLSYGWILELQQPDLAPQQKAEYYTYFSHGFNKV